MKRYQRFYYLIGLLFVLGCDVEIYPQADFEADIREGLLPLTVQFKDKSTPGIGKIKSWCWEFGDSGKSKKQNPKCIYKKAGHYTVKLTVKTVTGQSTKVIKDYIIVNEPVETITTTSTTSVPDTASSTSTTSTALTTTSVISSTTTSVSSGNNGSTTTVPTTSISGTTSSVSTTTTISPVASFSAFPLVGPVTLTVSFTDNSTVTAGNIKICDNETDNETCLKILSWLWNFGDNQTSADQHPVHTYMEAGKYTVALTVTASYRGNIIDDSMVKEKYIRVLPFIPHKAKGFYFAPFDENQVPGDVISEEQIRERLEIIEPYTESIKFYVADNIPEIANEMLFEEIVIAGWISSNKQANEGAIQNLIDIGNQGQVDIIIFGSGVMQRGDLTEDELLINLNQVRNAVPAQTIVSYSDNYLFLLNHPNITDNCSKIFAEIYPYWESVPIDEAIDWLEEKYDLLKTQVGDKEIIIETGWPSDLSVEDACQYFKEFTTWARENEIKYHYFSAYDEAWRNMSWGIWDSQGELKECLKSAFE